MQLKDNAQGTLTRMLCINYAKGAMLPFINYRANYDQRVAQFVVEHEAEFSKQAKEVLDEITQA
jgi:hypothetical protein